MVPAAGAALAAAAGSYRALFIILAATSAFSAVLVRTAALSSRARQRTMSRPGPYHGPAELSPVQARGLGSGEARCEPFDAVA